MNWPQIVYYAPLVTGLLTLLSFVVAAWGLFALHIWNRRNAAIQMIHGWNPQTVEHRRALETRFPGIIDYSVGMPLPKELTPNVALVIYTADPSTDPDDWNLRFHFVQLLNYCEVISLAYLHHAVDRRLIDAALRTTLVRWHEMLKPFMSAVTQKRGSDYHPWKPFSDYVEFCARQGPPIPTARKLP